MFEDPEPPSLSPAWSGAEAAEREYRRATWHYHQLMQHRIRNPLQVLIGIADTLVAYPDLEPSRREALVEAMADQARVLASISLEPSSSAASEQSLQAVPTAGAAGDHLHVVGELEADRPPDLAQNSMPRRAGIPAS